MGMTMSFVSHRTEAVRAMNDVAAQRMEAACITVQGETQVTFAGQRHGKVYKLPTTRKSRFGGALKSGFVLSGGTQQKRGTGKRYTASAPGEAPAVRLGGLKSSIKYKIQNIGRKLTGDVGTKLPYGRALEYGYPPNNLKARPWLRRSFESAEGRIVTIWRQRWF